MGDFPRPARWAEAGVWSGVYMPPGVKMRGPAPSECPSPWRRAGSLSGPRVPRCAPTFRAAIRRGSGRAGVSRRDRGSVVLDLSPVSARRSPESSVCVDARFRSPGSRRRSGLPRPRDGLTSAGECWGLSVRAQGPGFGRGRGACSHSGCACPRAGRERGPLRRGGLSPGRPSPVTARPRRRLQGAPGSRPDIGHVS